MVDEPKSGSVTVPVTLRRTPGSSNAVVVFATVGGTATAGADYTSIFRQLVVFGPTELERVIPVTILADAEVEGTERINLSLRNPTGGPVRGSPGDAVIEIRDEDQPEIYFCVHGTGYLLMETRDGQFQAAPWKPGAITHIPGMWAHRVVNTGSDELFFVASYHLAAGHIYAPVVERGFAQIVVEQNGQPVFLPNPRRV